MQKAPWSEIEWWGKVITVIVIFLCAWVIYFSVPAIYEAIYERIRSSSWWKERKACAEWTQSFPDSRLIEIVRKDVDGFTFDRIGDFYGVSGGCIEKRINEDRELYDRLKVLYISRNY